MNTQQVLDASNVLSWFAAQASTPGEHPEKRVEMALSIVLAQSYLVEYARNTSRGLEPYDAFIATIQGALEIPAGARDVLRALTPPAGGSAA